MKWHKPPGSVWEFMEILCQLTMNITSLYILQTGLKASPAVIHEMAHVHIWIHLGQIHQWP